MDDATLNEVMRLVQDIAPDAFDGLKTHRCKELAVRMIRKARGWGMTEMRDIAIYCALYRYPGPIFFRRRAWVDAADRVKDGQITWAMAFEEPHIWEEPQQDEQA